MKFSITYYDPFSYANFKCEALTKNAARAKLETFNAENGFDIPTKEIKSIKWAGKPQITLYGDK